MTPEEIKIVLARTNPVELLDDEVLASLCDLVRTRSTGTLLMARQIESQPDIASLAGKGRAVDRLQKMINHAFNVFWMNFFE